MTSRPSELRTSGGAVLDVRVAEGGYTGPAGGRDHAIGVVDRADHVVAAVNQESVAVRQDDGRIGDIEGAGGDRTADVGAAVRTEVGLHRTGQ